MKARSALFALSLIGALCAGQAVHAATPTVPVVKGERLVETGVATWYGGHRVWNRTASGERFEPTKMTAAHRNLPLGTIVRVTDLATGRSVVVRVNDREPPHGRRCIDLSEGAATALGIHHQGVAHVTITAIEAADPVEVAEAPTPAVEPAAVDVPAAPTRPVRHRRAHH
jgi:rare lipoprotein A